VKKDIKAALLSHPSFSSWRQWGWAYKN
jgi:hypothetical protein